MRSIPRARESAVSKSGFLRFSWLLANKVQRNYKSGFSQLTGQKQEELEISEEIELTENVAFGFSPAQAR